MEPVNFYRLFRFFSYIFIALKVNRMNCYNHHSVTAVAVCKNCGKELCHDCLKGVNDEVVCANGCANDIDLSPDNRGKKLNNRNTGTYYGLAFMYFALAGTFFCTSYLYSQEKFLGLFVSGLFLVASILFVFAALKYKKHTEF